MMDSKSKEYIDLGQEYPSAKIVDRDTALRQSLRQNSISLNRKFLKNSPDQKRSLSRKKLQSSNLSQGGINKSQGFKVSLHLFILGRI
jgi:hypothetical protein